MLVNLEKHDMVEISIGRSGSTITDFGIKALSCLKMG
jgi:hypothetical protein